jgi:hypothetical protein
MTMQQEMIQSLRELAGRLHDKGANTDAVLILRTMDELERLCRLYYPPKQEESWRKHQKA